MTKFVGNRITFPKLSAAPSSPVSGDTYYDTTFNKPFTYSGTEWIDLTLTSATTGATGYWGSFWSTQDQTAASANTAYNITFNNTDADSSGVSIVSNSRVTFAYSGVYSIIYSVQFVNTSNSIYDANIWLKKNGSNVADSDSKWSVVGSHGGVNGHAIGSVNYVLKVTAGDYFELAWQTTNTAISIEADPAASPAPAIPSVILTATQVMNTQVGPTGATGPAGPAATPTAMNYAQTQGTKQTTISASGVTIVSTSITTLGYPVQVLVTGDAENNGAGAWVKLQLYRDSTAIGKQIHVESSAGSENIPYSLTVIDTPSAGTYTYSLKTANAVSGGSFNFGETDGPVITAIELTGGVGPQGPAGSGSGDITSVAAGSGLTGGATSGDATLNVGAGTGIIVNADDVAIDTSVVARKSDDLSVFAASTSATIGVGSVNLGHATDTTLSRSAAGTLAVEGVDVVTTSGTQTLTNKTLTGPVIDNPKIGYSTTVASATPVVLTNASNYYQYFTGSTSGQVVTLPVASTLVLGQQFEINNNTSSGAMTVNSSGGNLVKSVDYNTTWRFTCILTSGTTAASWESELVGVNSITGSAGSGAVMSGSPTISGPTLTSYLRYSTWVTTASSGGNLALSSSGTFLQKITGSLAHTVTLSATATAGTNWIIYNTSTGDVTVNASAGGLVATLKQNQAIRVFCNTTSGTTPAAWDVFFFGGATATGTGASVFATSPTLTGTPLINNNAASPASTSNAQGTVLQLVNADTYNTRIVQDAHGTGIHGAYTIRRSRGTAASPTAVQADDKLGELGARGYGATKFSDQSQGRIAFYASETWTDSVAGTYAAIEVTPTGSNGVSSGLTVTSSSVSLPSGSELKINGNSVLSASTLGSGVTASSLTSVGTITTGTWTGTTIAIANGGTGATTAENAINALVPSQASNAGKLLKTDGTSVSWTTASLAIADATIDGGGA